MLNDGMIYLLCGVLLHCIGPAKNCNWIGPLSLSSTLSHYFVIQFIYLKYVVDVSVDWLLMRLFVQAEQITS